MKKKHKAIFRAQLPVFLCQVILCAAMLLVFFLIGRMNAAVVLGALAGAAISLLNYTAMIFSLLKAEQCDSPQRGQLKAQGNYILRMILMVAALLLAVKLGKTDPIATLLPIVLMRIALFIGGFIIKKDRKEDIAE